MERLAALLQWAHENKVRVTIKFIPDQASSPFVIEAQCPRPEAGKHFYEFVRVRNKTLRDVAHLFMRRVNG